MSRRFWQPELRREVDDELEFHLEMRARELIGQGMTPEAARAEARRRLGDVPAMRRSLLHLGKERDRTMRRTEWLAELRQDLAYGFRTLARNPGFTAIALLTLGVGIGATTAIFSAVNAVVLRPLPIPEVDRIALVSEYAKGRETNVSVGNFVDWEAANAAHPVFTSLGAINWASFTLSGGDGPERVLGAQVSAGYFGVFAVAPLLGRTFRADEAQPGGPRVAVLSHRLWRRRFGGSPGMLDSVISVNGQAVRVIGIMPARFDLTNGTEELWLPAAFTPAQRAQHDEHYLTVYGRLAKGVSIGSAASLLEGVMRDLRERYPLENAGSTAHLQPMMQQFVGDARGQLFLVLGAVVLVLLIACANVANLLLARGAARTRELAIRASIGAGRGRIVRQLLAESAVLALAAAGIGTGVAWIIIRTLVAAAPEGVPRIEQARLDGATLGFTLLVALGSTFVFGLAPALRAARTDLQAALRTGQAKAGGARRDWLRQGLVTAEVALALLLLVGATLLVRTVINVQRLDPGFAPHGVLTARVSLPVETYGSPEASRRAFEAMVDNLARAPGVRRAALVTQVPMGPGSGDNGLIPEGKPLEPASAVGARFRLITPGYLATMGITITRGRDFGPDDRAGAPRGMIVNEALARALFPGEDAIGKRVACCEGAPADPMWKTIVGVIGDVRSQGPDQDIVREFYLPMAQAPDPAWNWINRTMNLVALADGDPMRLAPALREAVRRVDPELPLYRLDSMEHILSGSLAPARFRTALLGSLAGVGLLLALVGIYGVVSYLVARRRAEIGVRVALGASPADVVRLVVGEGVRPVLLGTLLGGIVALGATRLLGSWLRGVSPTDPLTFAVAAVSIVLVAVLASLVPARRATKVDPLTAIRAD